MSKTPPTAIEQLGRLVHDNLVSIVIGALGLGATFYFYLKSQRTRKPVYQIRNTLLIQDYSASLSSLQVQYNQQAIRNLSVARVTLWNAGREPIDRQDVSAVNPIAITMCNDARLLEIAMLHKNDDFCGLAIAEPVELCKAQIEFEYLNPGAGAVFQVMHTGTTAADLKIAGSGAGFERVQPNTDWSVGDNFITVWSFAGLVVLLSANWIESHSPHSIFTNLGTLPFLLMILVLPRFMPRWLRRKLSSVPKGLEETTRKN